MAYLITCAGSKRQPNLNISSSLQNLSYNQTLGDARINLLNLTNIQLNWDLTLPAWQLYSGNRSKLYPRITQLNWQKECVEIKILSALFGWINHNDLLPMYDLRMNDLILNTNERVWQYWENQNLLNQFIDHSDIDLLSGDYRRAITGNKNPVATLPNAQFNDYGVQKGNWLNNELTNIRCI